MQFLLHRREMHLSRVLLVVVSLFASIVLGYNNPYPASSTRQYKPPNHGHHHHQYTPASHPPLVKPKATLEPFFQWKQMDFYDAASPDLTPLDARSNFDDSAAQPANNVTFNQYNNVPLGIARYKDKLFVSVPRRAPGIPSTLNYVSMSGRDTNPSPLLRSFPDYATNRLEAGDFIPSPDRIFSVYRPRVDYICDRLWFIDTGLLEFGDRPQVQQPSIWIVDLKTMQRVHRFEIPTSIVTTGIGLASLTIDAEAGHCDEAFAYIPDFFNSRLHVFSLAENRMWSFIHSYFHIDPLYSNFAVAGQRYQWRDGIFSITLGPKMQENDGKSHRVAMFHAMSSLNEFTVSTAVLKNSTAAARSFHGDDFQWLGRRQEMGQSAMHGYDATTGIVFYAEVGRNAIGCWNSKRRFHALNHDIVYKDDVNMIYPSDMMVDDEGFVWVMSNTMPRFIYARLNETEYNFKIWRGNGRDMVAGTYCELE